MKILKGITSKSDGNMRIAVKDGAKNREVYFCGVGLESKDLVLGDLVHGNEVVLVEEKERGKILKNCDALITDVPNLIIGVTAADCLPIYFWNRQKTAIGIAHAGWRGVKGKITEKVVGTFVHKYNCRADDLYVEVGPHILDCHFEIKNDLVEIFKDYSEFIKGEKDSKYLNLQKVIRKQLIAVGLQKKNIKLTTKCTHCDKDYYSYRRDKPKDIEAMLAYLVLKK